MRITMRVLSMVEIVVLAAVVGGTNRSVWAQGLQFQNDNGRVRLTVDGQSLLEYQAESHPFKVYISRWYSPRGVQILRDSPHDHVHHHAFMFAVGIDKIDFWGEEGKEQNGKQVPRSLGTQAATQNGKGTASLQQAIDWVGPDGTVLGVEERVITAHRGAVPNASLLSWKTRLSPASQAAAADLWGRHYFGLGMRFVESMDHQGHFFNSANAAGKTVRGTEKLVRGNWCAYVAAADGKKVTVAMFDDPGNPRHPATWFTMTEPFAYLAATQDLQTEPLRITADQPFRARFGAALWDGEVSRDEVQRVYELWRALP